MDNLSSTRKTILIVIFVVVGAAILAGAMWYADNILNAPSSASAPGTATESASTTTAPAQNQTNSTNPSQTMDGLQIKDTTVGTGTVAQNGDWVTVNYTGTFDNGTVFDSSLKPGRTPFTFQLGAGNVIKGWDLGVLGMKVGGTRELVIPSDLGYGAADYGPIPGGSTLHFTVALLSVSSSSPQ